MFSHKTRNFREGATIFGGGPLFFSLNLYQESQKWFLYQVLLNFERCPSFFVLSEQCDWKNIHFRINIQMRPVLNCIMTLFYLFATYCHSPLATVCFICYVLSFTLGNSLLYLLRIVIHPWQQSNILSIGPFLVCNRYFNWA